MIEPKFELKGNNIYNTAQHRAPGEKHLPWFKVRGDRVISTEHHPQGPTALPWFKVREGQVFQTIHHPGGHSIKPIFKLPKS